MPNTRFDLTKTEKRKLKLVATEYRTLIKLVADYLKRRGSEISIGTPYVPTESVHMAYDQADWDQITGWLNRYGNVKINHLAGKRTTRKELLLHVAGLVAAEHDPRSLPIQTNAVTEKKRVNELLRWQRKLEILDRKIERRRFWQNCPQQAERDPILAQIKRLSTRLP